MSKARNLSDFISDPTISSTEIADQAVTTSKLAGTLDFSSKTMVMADNQLSGDKIHGGTISAFASTGIDDNASSTAVTILSDGTVGIGTDVDRGGILNVDGTTKGIVVRTTSSSAMELIHADNGAGVGPYLYLNRPSSGPAANDQIGRIVIQGKNSADEVIDYVRLVNQIINPTDGSEQGRFAINTMSSGTMNSRLNIVNGESVFNDESIDVDFRVESNNNTHALFVQGSDGNVGIGASPTEKLHVEGDVRVADDASIQFGGGKFQTLTGGGGGNDLLYRTYQAHIFKVTTGSTSKTDGTQHLRIDGEGLKVGTGTGGGNPPANTSILFGSSDNRNIQFLGQSASGVEGTIGAWNGVYNFQSSKIVFNKPAGNVGDMQFYTNQGAGPVKRMTIQHNGTILVNRSSNVEDTKMNINHSTSWGLVLDGDGSGTDNHIMFNRSGGTRGYITSSSSSVSYSTTSDYRLKENIVSLTGAAARVNQLNPARFNFIIDETDTLVDGFLAHEVADVVPEAITGTKDAMKDEEYEVTPAVLDDDGNETTAAVMGTRSVPDYQGIDQSKLVPLLTAALQEALAEIASLKTRVEALE